MNDMMESADAGFLLKTETTVNIYQQDKRRRVSARIVLGLMILFFGIRIFGPWAVETLYTQEKISVLSSWTRAAGNQPLDFYLGMMENQVFGPVSVLIATVVLLVFSLVFLEKAGKRIFFLSLFLYFLIVKFEVLFFPPYGDSSTGPFIEAIWLKENAFDFAGLARQPNFIYGGPKVYLLSYYPSLLAVLMKLIPSVKTFLCVNHILVFLMAAAILTFFREILLRVFSPRTALCGIVLLVSLPLFQSQVEAVNMEMPTLFFGMLSMYYLVEKKLCLAGILSIVSAWAKPTGIFFIGTVFFTGLYLFFTDRQHKFKAKTLLFIIVPLASAAAQMYWAFQLVTVDMMGTFKGWEAVKSFQDSYLYVFNFLFLGGIFIKEKFSKIKQTIHAIAGKHYVALVAFLCVSGWFVLFINSTAGFPRYRLVMIPFNLFLAMYVTRFFIKSENFFRGAVISLALFYSICSYGFLFPPIISEDQVNDHVQLERSLEYRNDLIFRMKLAKAVEDKFAGFTIAAPFVVAQNLALPELGYVQKKLNVMIYGFPCLYGNIQIFHGMDDLDPTRVMWVGLKSTIKEYLGVPLIYPVGPDDWLMERIVFGVQEGYIFRGGNSIEKMRLISKAAIKYLMKTKRIDNPFRHNFGL